MSVPGGPARRGFVESLLRSRFVQSASLRRLVPERLRALVRRRVPVAVYVTEQHRRDAELLFGGPLPRRSEGSGCCPLRIGIFADEDWGYSAVVSACRELGLAYEVV